jgi:hypothetical protein
LSEQQQARIDKLLSQSEGLRTFITEELVETDGADLSNDEIVVGYATYAKAKGWRVPRRRIIENQLQDLMLEIWASPQAHNIQRDGKTSRGYRGIRIRGESETDPF